MKYANPYLEKAEIALTTKDSKILTDILREGKDDVISRRAYKNPNCPDEAKIKWMQATGKIVKEDPIKHIIEYEKIKEDNFQDLKDLL